MKVLTVSLFDEGIKPEVQGRLLSKWLTAISVILGDEVIVSSSNLESIKFDGTAGELFVRFKGGGVYKYANVSVALFENFMDSPSKGKFFHANVKGKFPYQKVG